MYFLEKIKKILAKEVNNVLGKKYISHLDFKYPPGEISGDLSLPCFVVAKEKKISPAELTKEISQKIKKNKYILKVESAGPYVNFFLNGKNIFKVVLENILKEKEKHGTDNSGKGKGVMIEFSNANTHKEYHVGHLRNLCYGDAVTNLISSSGYKAIPVSYINDFGIHVAKTLWAYNKFHKGKKDSNSEGNFLGKIYAQSVEKIGDDEKLKEEVNELMKSIETRKGEDYKLWQKTRKWSIEQFSEIYKELGIKFKDIFYESEVIEDGRKMVKDLLKKGILEESQGAIIANLEKDDLGVLMFLRSDGTALYPVADIPLAVKKFKKYKLEKSIYVVDVRQSLYFKQLFKVLNNLGFSQDLVHLGYEFVKLSSGMISSRTGNVITFEKLWAEAIKRAVYETSSRHKDWSKKKIQEVSRKIVIGAIKFEMIKVSKEKIITFDIDKALKFDGFTSSYIQYTHARICSILKKTPKEQNISSKKVDFSKLQEETEYKLINFLIKYPETIKKAGSSYNPAIVAEFIYELAKVFNDFYRDVPVIKAGKEVREVRISLIRATQVILKNGLKVLGINALDEM